MLFENALSAMRKGFIAYRKSWPPNITVGLQKGYPEGVPANRNTQELFEIEDEKKLKVDPYFQLFVAGEDRLQNYTPTTGDILSDDWEILKL